MAPHFSPGACFFSANGAAAQTKAAPIDN